MVNHTTLSHHLQEAARPRQEVVVVVMAVLLGPAAPGSAVTKTQNLLMGAAANVVSSQYSQACGPMAEGPFRGPGLLSISPSCRRRFCLSQQVV